MFHVPTMTSNSTASSLPSPMLTSPMLTSPMLTSRTLTSAGAHGSVLTDSPA